MATSTLLDRVGEHGITLDSDRKDQHLLVSPQAVSKLVASARLSKEDVVLEIGPGPGQITEELCCEAGFVYAIEVDERFEPILSDIKARYANLEVFYGSALEVTWPQGVTKVVTNPPFSILEPLVTMLVRTKQITTVCMVIGEEYYKRCTAQSERMTRTGLLTMGFFDVELIETLDKDAFSPRARERAVIMRMTRKDKKKADFGIRMLASRVISMPNETVRGFLSNLIGGKLNVRTMDVRSIPTVRSLGLSDSLQLTKLGELDNKGITDVVKSINALKRSFRHF